MIDLHLMTEETMVKVKVTITDMDGVVLDDLVIWPQQKFQSQQNTPALVSNAVRDHIENKFEFDDE